MEKSNLRLAPPTEVKRTVVLARRPNAELRTREHLTAGEVEALIEAAKANRHGHRDATMILVAFRHGLRAAELCDLRWDQVGCGRSGRFLGWHTRRNCHTIANMAEKYHVVVQQHPNWWRWE